MTKAKKIALGASITALCCVLMLITAVFPFVSYAAPILAGLLLVFIAIEINKKWAFLCYITVSLLSLVVTADYSAILAFILFFGYYPILKGVIEKIRKPVIEWILKVISFNLAIFLGLMLMFFIIGADAFLKEYLMYGYIGLAVLLVLANAMFVLYDIFLTRMISLLINFFIPKYLTFLR